MSLPEIKSQAGKSPIETYETVWGTFHGFANDTGVSGALREYGEYFLEEISVYERLLNDGETFVDVGANIGVMSRGVAEGRPEVAVIGLEPHIDYFRLAAVNTLALGNVTMLHLGAAERQLILYVDEIGSEEIGNFGGKPVRSATSKSRCPCVIVRLGDFLKNRGVIPRLIKIDVEGMEPAVIGGCLDLVHEDLVISVEADRLDVVPRTINALRDIGVTRFFAFFPKRISDDKLDKDSGAVRMRSAQLLGFVGPVPDWILDKTKFFEVRSIEDYTTIFKWVFTM